MSNNTSSTLTTSPTPNFFDLLSADDKIEYFKLKSSLDGTVSKRNRGHRVEAFGAILDEIQKYVERGDENDWKRSLVCGVCRMNNMIAINIRQLRLLITKCKSSINGSLQRLGYLTNPSHAESWKMFIEKIPFLKNNYTELRQWTIRCKNEPVAATPLLPVEISITPFPYNPYLPNYCIQPIPQPNNITPVCANAFIPVKIGFNAPTQVYPNYAVDNSTYHTNLDLIGANSPKETFKRINLSNDPSSTIAYSNDVTNSFDNINSYNNHLTNRFSNRNIIRINANSIQK